MQQLDSAVVYDGLPISSGGAHHINRLSPAQALEAWRSFQSACTRPSPPEACFIVSNDRPAPKVPGAVVRRIKDTFPDHESLTRQCPVPPERLDDAVRLYEEIANERGDWGEENDVALAMESEFRLLSPAGRDVWPGQERSSFGHFETPGGARLGTSSTRMHMSESCPCSHGAELVFKLLL